MSDNIYISSKLNENQSFAPIALFVYKRHDHTFQTLTALSRNPEFSLSPLFIYCDGPRSIEDLNGVERTRELVRNWPHPQKYIIEAKKNQGLAESIISGVTELIEHFGQIIVVEDDLVVSSDFLSYLNSALQKYKNLPEVMQISAYMFPIIEFSSRNETLFLPNISSWGWATWDRAWKKFDAKAKGWEELLDSRELRFRFNVDGSYNYSDMLLRQMNGEINSWAIRWNWSVFRHNGLVVYPPTSYVRNTGFDGSGTHCARNDYFEVQVSSNCKKIVFPELIEVSCQDKVLVKNAMLVMGGGALVRALKLMRATVRRFRIKLIYSTVGK
jgi:hypothetical protein